MERGESFMEVVRPQAKTPRHVAEKRAVAPKTRRVAVVVVHGMGQQLPFETLDSLVRGLRRVDAAKANAAPAKVRVRLARVAAKDLPRAEIDLVSKRTQVHLYEAYWAPITEGRVGLRDVTRFVVAGAFRGLRNAVPWRGFTRWMFGKPQTNLPTSPATAIGFVAFLLTFASLALVNAAAAAVATTLFVSSRPSFLSAETIATSAVWIGWMLAGAIASALLMTVLKSRIFLAPTLAALIGCGVVVVAVPLSRLHAMQQTPATWSAIGWGPLVVWLGLLAASAYVRTLLVQYVGDVAAYVDSHELDRFQDIRNRIKAAVRDVADAVYRDREGGKFAYDEVAVVAHSLGALAAYDCLNALVDCDVLEPGKSADVVKRTSLFLTFGAPLDKTAFVFRQQGATTDEPREALAAAVQPMIQDYAYRTFPWVNVWSKNDVISGELDYYDDPALPKNVPPRVVNREDLSTRTPIKAHVEYWNGTMIFEQLLDRL